MWLSTKTFISCSLLIKTYVVAYYIGDNDINACHLPDTLINEIDTYKPLVETIINMTTSGSYKGITWDDLSYFVDKFGARFTGTQALEDSIDYVLNKSVALGFENVHGDEVDVPVWVRGEESATLLFPRKKKIALLGLGYSVGTPAEGIIADAIVVNSFSELQERSSEVPGKIVVYNQNYVTYGETVKYRSNGASAAAKLGAVAALIRSITPFSLYTPHTGMMDYENNVTKIPAACITAEDSSLLRRLSERGNNIRIHLKMDANNLNTAKSRNVIAEIQGSQSAEKVVVVSGHVDSWDVGQGAMDDGGGAFISWNALKLLKQLNYRPRRTLRLIMWTAEEMGIIGASQYIERYKPKEKDLQFVMESDIGTFAPMGLKFTGTKEVECILEKLMELLEPLGEMKLTSPAECPDAGIWIDSGVPGASLWNDNSKYFWYHHTEADTMLVEDPEALDKNTALFATVAYVLADISVDLPHHKG
ncbi:carboxypeptidase Q-like [Prorops nasuta]|uniref:carboxypeptidase Q-like n=1 Tax=Prorops nasuta TaxID=863751 RepID=UPI0034CD103D